MIPDKSSLTENTVQADKKISIQNFCKLCSNYAEKNIVHSNKTIKTTLTQYKKYADSLIPSSEDFDSLAIGARNHMVKQSLLLNFTINTIPDDFKKCFGVPEPNLLIRNYYAPIVYMYWRYPGCNIYKKYIIKSPKSGTSLIKSFMYVSIKYGASVKYKLGEPLQILHYKISFKVAS